MAAGVEDTGTMIGTMVDDGYVLYSLCATKKTDSNFTLRVVFQGKGKGYGKKKQTD